MTSRPARGGGRWLTVAPERLERWLAGFADNHGGVTCEVDLHLIVLRAPDGSAAECHVPFPPLPPAPEAAYGGLVAHAVAERRVGVLLVRLGGHAAGVFDGTRLVSSKVGSRQVQGRSAAGGWSQQRFARRREGQARVAMSAAVDVAVRILVPAASNLDAVVTGGDRGAVEQVLSDARLRALVPLVVEPHLQVPDPRLRILEATPQQFRAVRIRVEDTDRAVR